MDQQPPITPPTADQLPPMPPPEQPAPQPEAKPPIVLNKTERYKRSFFRVLLGCLVGAAAIAVIAVLMGSFNNTLARALATIATVAIHALFSFGYISESEKRDQKDGGRSPELFSNIVFTLLVISFVTSVFAIWGFLSAHLTLKLYMLYGVTLIATLHADVLYRLRHYEKNIDTVITANYGFMAAVVLLLSVVIFAPNPADLSQIFYRILAATGIVDATMTITAIIMHKLYLQKHPELAAQSAEETKVPQRSFWKNPIVVLILIYLGFQVIVSVGALIFRGF